MDTNTIKNLAKRISFYTMFFLGFLLMIAECESIGLLLFTKFLAGVFIISAVYLDFHQPDWNDNDEKID